MNPSSKTLEDYEHPRFEELLSFEYQVSRIIQVAQEKYGKDARLVYDGKEWSITVYSIPSPKTIGRGKTPLEALNNSNFELK